MRAERVSWNLAVIATMTPAQQCASKIIEWSDCESLQRRKTRLAALRVQAGTAGGLH